MRKQLVIALAYDLKNFTNREEAYAWFTKTVEEYKLDSHEQFSLVFVGGGMNHRPEVETAEPKTYPWEGKPGDREISPAEFERLHQQKFETAKNIEEHHNIIARKNPPIKQKPVTPSAKCLKDARKALGAYPYNEGCNFLVGDGYFSRSCVDKYGSRQWEAALEQVRNEMKR